MKLDEIQKFEGLNVSSKFAICGLPIRLDSYKTCSFGCKYCFANARKIMEFEKTLQIADVESIERRFNRVFVSGDIGRYNLLDNLLKRDISIHFGGMSDPFQPVNEELKITNKIVDVCNKYNRTILFSTKSDTVHNANIRPDLHSFQLSVSNISNRTDIEENVPDIQRRIDFFKELKKAGFRVGIRMQPFIPDITTLEIVKAFNGADHFIIEGIKVVPQNDEQKEYIFQRLNLKKSMFIQKGLLTLKPNIRLEYYKPFIDYFNENGISYSISDNDLRKYTNNQCCCGDKLCTNATTFNSTSLIYKYGKHYTFRDVRKEIEKYGIGDCKCSDLFTSNRTQNCTTVMETYKRRFSQKTSPFSPRFQYGDDAQLTFDF